MIKITNESDEAYSISQFIDPQAPGRRVLHVPLGSTVLQPGESICLVGYEPGIDCKIHPVKDPHIPRSGFSPPPVEAGPSADGTESTSQEQHNE